MRRAAPYIYRRLRAKSIAGSGVQLVPVCGGCPARACSHSTKPPRSPPSHEEVLRAFANVGLEGGDEASAESECDEQGGVEEVVSATHYGSDGRETVVMGPTIDFSAADYDWDAIERMAGVGKYAPEGEEGEDADGEGPGPGAWYAKIDDLPENSLDFEIILDAEAGVMDLSYDVVEDEEGVVEAVGDGDGAVRALAAATAAADTAPRLRAAKESWRVAAPALPRHTKRREKPGMARRVAMLEAEMGRVVAETAARCEAWECAALDVDGVGLSGNMCDLTVFYSATGVGGGAAGGAAGQVIATAAAREMEWRVRRAIAAELDLKYAPRVRFRETAGGLDGEGGGGGGGGGGRAELDILFDRIERERAAGAARS
jgi:ribosome-binding factor A